MSKRPALAEGRSGGQAVEWCGRAVCACEEQAVAAYESEACQKALVAFPDGVERDFRITEGTD